MFKGSFVALLTPFKDGKFDESTFRSLVDWQINEGTDGLVPCGTTGESPTLSHKEHRRVTEICIEVTNGRVPVIAGAGSNSTEEAISLAQHAKSVGTDAVLIVTPYYNKPTQAGLYEHYKAINDAAKIPIIIYNIPGRSIIDMNVETMSELAKLDEMRTAGASRNDVADAFPVDLLRSVGYFGKAEGAAKEMARLSKGLDNSIVRVVSSSPGTLEGTLKVLNACAPAQIRKHL